MIKEIRFRPLLDAEDKQVVKVPKKGESYKNGECFHCAEKDYQYTEWPIYIRTEVDLPEARPDEIPQAEPQALTPKSPNDSEINSLAEAKNPVATDNVNTINGLVPAPQPMFKAGDWVVWSKTITKPEFQFDKPYRVFDVDSASSWLGFRHTSRYHNPDNFRLALPNEIPQSAPQAEGQWTWEQDPGRSGNLSLCKGGFRIGYFPLAEPDRQPERNEILRAVNFFGGIEIRGYKYSVEDVLKLAKDAILNNADYESFDTVIEAIDQALVLVKGDA